MPTISTVKTDKPSERERETFTRLPPNKKGWKVNRKNATTETEITAAASAFPPLQERLPAAPIEPSFHPTLHAGGERRNSDNQDAW